MAGQLGGRPARRARARSRIGAMRAGCIERGGGTGRRCRAGSSRAAGAVRGRDPVPARAQRRGGLRAGAGGAGLGAGRCVRRRCAVARRLQTVPTTGAYGNSAPRQRDGHARVLPGARSGRRLDLATSCWRVARRRRVRHHARLPPAAAHPRCGLVHVPGGAVCFGPDRRCRRRRLSRRSAGRSRSCGRGGSFRSIRPARRRSMPSGELVGLEWLVGPLACLVLHRRHRVDRQRAVRPRMRPGRARAWACCRRSSCSRRARS